MEHLYSYDFEFGKLKTEILTLWQNFLYTYVCVWKETEKKSDSTL